MVTLLLDLAFGTVVIYAFIGFFVLALVAASAALVSQVVSSLAARVRPRGAMSLQWSRPVDEVARALAGEQAVVFSVKWRRGVRRRHLEFMLVPLVDLPSLECGPPERGLWHVFCPDRSSACTAALPWNGTDLVARLRIPTAEAQAGAEAFDAVMSRMVGLLWGAG